MLLNSKDGLPEGVVLTNLYLIIATCEADDGINKFITHLQDDYGYELIDQEGDALTFTPKNNYNRERNIKYLFGDHRSHSWFDNFKACVWEICDKYEVDEPLIKHIHDVHKDNIYFSYVGHKIYSDGSVKYEGVGKHIWFDEVTQVPIKSTERELRKKYRKLNSDKSKLQDNFNKEHMHKSRIWGCPKCPDTFKQHTGLAQPLPLKWCDETYNEFYARITPEEKLRFLESKLKSNNKHQRNKNKLRRKLASGAPKPNKRPTFDKELSRDDPNDSGDVIGRDEDEEEELLNHPLTKLLSFFTPLEYAKEYVNMILMYFENLDTIHDPKSHARKKLLVMAIMLCNKLSANFDKQLGKYYE